MTGRKLLALVTPLVAVTLVLVAGVALAHESAHPQDYINPSPQQGSSWPPSYRMAMYEDLSTINYWSYLGLHSTVWNGYVLGNFTHSLYGLSAKRFDWIPVLAADFPSEQTQVGDFWVITVTLKPGVLWSDGTPFTAEDVVFTLDTCADLELSGNWSIYCPDVLDHAEATSDLSVTYYFSEEVGLGAWQAGVSMAPILPKHYWESIVEEAKTKQDPAAWLYDHVPENEPVLGPFMLKEWMPGSHVEIVPNPNYYFQGLQITEYANGAYQETLPEVYTFTAYGEPTGTVDLSFTVGPHVGSVRYELYPDQDAAYQALRDGEVNFVLNPLGVSSSIRESLESEPDVTTVLNPDYGLHYLAFNMRRSPMDVREFRQAVATLMDREFPGTDVEEETDPMWSVMPEGNVFWHNPDVPRIGEGLTRRERISDTIDLLTTAGFTWTVQPAWDPVSQEVIPGQGLHYSGTLVPEIELLAPTYDYDPLRATAALSTAMWLNEAGISVTAVLTDNIWGHVFTVDFDTYISGWSLGNIAFPTYFETFWHSRNDTAVSGGFNFPGYDNPVYDTLCDDFMSTTDIEQARGDAFEMQSILATDLPYIPLFTRLAFDAYRNDRITFPYTDVLKGIGDGMPELVRPICRVYLPVVLKNH